METKLKDQAGRITNHFLENPKGKILALYKMLDMGLSNEPDYAHRLYVFLPKEKIEDKTAKSLIK